MASPDHPTPADVATLALAVERDDQRPAAERTDREHQFAQAYRSDWDDTPGVALAWLEQEAAADEPLRVARERARLAQRGISALLALFGLFLGAGTAAALFTFDGDSRVNVVTIWAAFVLLPAALLVPFLVVALPPAVRRWVPGANALGALLQAGSPGRLSRLALRILPREWREAFERLTHALRRHQVIYAALQRWMLLRWSQVFAVGYLISALLAALVLVVFTDLAFGWSTTLTSGSAHADAVRLHRITNALALPWSWALPGAAPDLELIEGSRYFRAARGNLSVEQAARLGAWWQFVVLSMLTYGLLPRVLALIFTTLRLRGTTWAAIPLLPGVGPLVRRLRRATVETKAAEPEARAAVTSSELPEPPPAAPGPPEYRCVINWAAVPVDAAVLQHHFGPAPVYAAGGAASLDEEAAVVAATAATGERGSPVALVVKAWEPPLLELIDFLRALRQAVGPGATVEVFPVALDQAGSIRAPEEAPLTVWRHRLRRAEDPWLQVAATLPAEVRR